MLGTIAPPAFPTLPPLPAEKRVTASPANPGLPAAQEAAPAPADSPAEDQEENIYEVMKQHMKRQKEELDAKNAAMRAQRNAGAMGGRPGPNVPGRPGPQSQLPVSFAPVERVTDPTNLPGIWSAVRRWLTGPGQARTLESVLGHCCSLKSLNPTNGETILSIPHNQAGFTNERARLKLEEALRAVTPFAIKLAIDILPEEERQAPPPGADGSDPNNSAAARRVPPEVIDAVNAQPLIQQLSKLLDGKVTSVELLGEDE